MTGETLVLDKNFPSIKQGFSQHQAGKVGKMGFTVNVTGETLVLKKYFAGIILGKSLLFNAGKNPIFPT